MYNYTPGEIPGMAASEPRKEGSPEREDWKSLRKELCLVTAYAWRRVRSLEGGSSVVRTPQSSTEATWCESRMLSSPCESQMQ